MKVLVVDDDADIALMLARIFTHLGHQSEACSDAAEALEKALISSFDIVLADYIMSPNGVAVLSAFEPTNCFRVLITASYITVEVQEALAAGIIHEVLMKPATLADLRHVLCAAAVHL